MRGKSLWALNVLGWLLLAGPLGISPASGMGDPALSEPQGLMPLEEKRGEALSGPESYEFRYQEPVETGELPESGADMESGFVPSFEPGDSDSSGSGMTPIGGGDGPAREEFIP